VYDYVREGDVLLTFLHQTSGVTDAVSGQIGTEEEQIGLLRLRLEAAQTQKEYYSQLHKDRSERYGGQPTRLERAELNNLQKQMELLEKEEAEYTRTLALRQDGLARLEKQLEAYETLPGEYVSPRDGFLMRLALAPERDTFVIGELVDAKDILLEVRGVTGLAEGRRVRVRIGDAWLELDVYRQAEEYVLLRSGEGELFPYIQFRNPLRVALQV
ncbi:MAG TPA: hypothetical protein VN366_07570, partial [Feifaniaceae bacterium]|nr:hypothetical protein [Feifaniaceae bacterium]